MTVIRRPTADSISFGYDLAGRPSSVAFDRNGTSGTIGFTYNGVSGNLTSLSAPGGLGLAFTYDGSLPTSVTWSGAVSGSTAVTYNNDFRVTGQTVNGSHAVSFGYDLDGLLTQAGALGLRRAATNGRLDADSITVGDSVQKSAYGYDAHGALSALVNTRGSDTLFTTSYARDSLSRITELVERVNGATQVVGFTYDSVGRLATVTRNSVLTASYTYDLNGNRATKVTSGGTATAVVDDQDRLVSYGGASYAYTNNGELTRKIVGTDTTEYTYDALGNLTEVALPDGTAIGYLIDAQNRRIGKTVNDTLVRAWLYQGQLTPVAELDGAGNVVSRFVYATGVNVPDYMVRGDSTYRLIRDHLGSVRVVVNVVSGTIAQRMGYDEFGIETENTSPGWQPFGYAGGLTDSQTGLVRFGARDYDPVAGRWTAKDPIGFAGGSLGFYQYSGNDPIGFIDPTGEARIGIRRLGDRPAWYNPLLWAPVGPDYHVQIFYDDGGTPSNQGFFPQGVREDDQGGWSRGDYDFINVPTQYGGGKYFDDTLLRLAVAKVGSGWEAEDYSLVWRNCQDFMKRVVLTYQNLEYLQKHGSSSERAAAGLPIMRVPNR